MTYGYIKPEIIPEHRIFGASKTPYKIFREDGNWFASRPQKELQSKSFETYNCTSFNTLAQIEAYMKEVFGVTEDYSDRWLGLISGTKPPGNDPVKIYDAIREYGLIPDSMLPFSDDIKNVEEYYSFKGGDKDACYAEGKKWLEKWDFQHDWVFKPEQPKEEKIHNMKVALKSSPLTGDVDAWFQDERGLYVRRGESNHWTFFWAYDLNEKCEDSYEPTLKDVDQELFYCKRIYIEKKVVPIGVVKVSFWQKVINWLQNQIGLLKYFYGK